MIDSVIKTTSTMIEEIEYIAKTRKMHYMDAVIFWCEINNHEIEFAGEFIKKNVVLRSKIQLEAENLNFMKSNSRLPI
jgi:hypothetical protein